MKKHYSSPMVKIFSYDLEDVIRTSGQSELDQDNTKGYSFWTKTGEWED